MTFEALGIREDLLAAIQDLGFSEPTPIQQQAIPILLSGTRDFVGLAQTGTGKTAAFGLPILQLADAGRRHPQSLVVCPTRELCMQISQDLTRFAARSTGLHNVAVYGGTSIGEQIRELRKGPQVVVATPGRLIDLIERKAIQLEEITHVVLDEADEMLNMGFREDIEFILQNTPRRHSAWLFSATMPTEVRQVSRRFMSEPAEVSIGRVNAANANIDHQYFVCHGVNRYATLKRVIDFNPGIYGIIFTRTKADAQTITESLIREGYDIEALHGDLTQAQRDKVMGRFREKSLQLLIATDVAARGIDVTGISHVINYELPDDPEVYTHRAGRTGRAGRSGVCLSILTPRETHRIRTIERMIDNRLHRMDIPGGKDVCRKQFFHFIDRMLAADISHGDYETYLPTLREKFAQVDKEEILQRVAALEFDRFLQYYENAADLNVRDDRRPSRDTPKPQAGTYTDTRGRRFDRTDAEMRKLFVNLGIRDGFYKASFLQFILDMSDLRKESLGRIDMKDMNSWVEVEASVADKMIRSLDGKKFKGRRIRMNEADTGGDRPARRNP
jgi:ATP-dependent RNA helicase DeaD